MKRSTDIFKKRAEIREYALSNTDARDTLIPEETKDTWYDWRRYVDEGIEYRGFYNWSRNPIKRALKGLLFRIFISSYREFIQKLEENNRCYIKMISALHDELCLVQKENQEMKQELERIKNSISGESKVNKT